MFRAFSVLLFSALLGTTCHAPTLRPVGQLRLEYPKTTYTRFSPVHCPFSFDKSRYAQAADSTCWYNLIYPHMNATLYLTYKPIAGHYTKRIREVEKLTYKHAIKATYISG